MPAPLHFRGAHYKRVADQVLVASSAIVALTSSAFPYVRGYGTILFENVVLRAWNLIAHLSSGKFADLHHGVLWVVSAVLNVFFFLTIALPVWALFRSRAAKLASAAILTWLVLYIGMLFFIFPATDGP
jgi:hypothetical protein